MSTDKQQMMTCEQLAYDDDAPNLVPRAFFTLAQRNEIRVTKALGTRAPCRMNVQSHCSAQRCGCRCNLVLTALAVSVSVDWTTFQNNTKDENSLFWPCVSRLTWWQMCASFYHYVRNTSGTTGKFAKNTICSPLGLKIIHPISS